MSFKLTEWVEGPFPIGAYRRYIQIEDWVPSVVERCRPNRKYDGYTSVARVYRPYADFDSAKSSLWICETRRRKLDEWAGHLFDTKEKAMLGADILLSSFGYDMDDIFFAKEAESELKP